MVPGATCPPKCTLVERPGERGLCASANPPRRRLLPQPDGFDITLIARDAHGNRTGIGGDEVTATWRIEHLAKSKLAQRLRAHISPLDPYPPTIVDRGDGTYSIHLQGMRPCRPPKPAVNPNFEEDEESGTLSESKWLGKIVKKKETDYEALAIVDKVDGTQIVIRWLETNETARGTPQALLEGIDEYTLVSDSLLGRTEPTDEYGPLDIRALVVDGKRADDVDQSGPLTFVVDDGKKVSGRDPHATRTPQSHARERARPARPDRAAPSLLIPSDSF